MSSCKIIPRNEGGTDPEGVSEIPCRTDLRCSITCTIVLRDAWKLKDKKFRYIFYFRFCAPRSLTRRPRCANYAIVRLCDFPFSVPAASPQSACTSSPPHGSDSLFNHGFRGFHDRVGVVKLPYSIVWQFESHPCRDCGSESQKPGGLVANSSKKGKLELVMLFCV